MSDDQYYKMKLPRLPVLKFSIFQIQDGGQIWDCLRQLRRQKNWLIKKEVIASLKVALGLQQSKHVPRDRSEHAHNITSMCCFAEISETCQVYLLLGWTWRNSPCLSGVHFPSAGEQGCYCFPPQLHFLKTKNHKKINKIMLKDTEINNQQWVNSISDLLL